MSESDTDGHFTSGIPTVLLVVVVSVPLVFAVFAYNFFVPASEENTRTFLRTLVQAESSIIAIVFSVIFLGVQVISSRYTSRMGRLFFRDRLIQFTIGILSLAIGLDLLLLYLLPTDQGSLFVAALYFSVGLSMVAFYSLYLSVKRMLKSSTPEGVIHTSRNLTTYDDFNNYAKGDLSSPPTRGLFSFITASMSEHELITAKIAFEEYIGLINQLSLEALNRDAFNKLRSEEVTRAFEPIFIHQLPSIFQTAIRENDRFLKDEVIACHRQLAQAVGVKSPLVATIAAKGFVETFKEVDEYEAAILRQYFGMLYHECKNRRYDTLHDLSTTLSELFLDNLNAEELPKDIIHPVTDFFPIIQRRLLMDSESEITVVGKRVMHGRTNNTSNDYPVRSLINLQELLLVLSVKVSEEPPVFRRRVGYELIIICWKKFCINAFQLSSDNYSKYLTQIFIELAIIDLCSERPSSSKEEWANALGEIQFRGEREIVDGAFDELYEYLEVKRTSGMYQSVSEEGEQLEITNTRIDTSYQELEEKLEDLQSDAFVQYEYLIWENNNIDELRNIIQLNPDIVEEGLSHDMIAFPYNQPGNFDRSQLSYLSGRYGRGVREDSILMRDSNNILTFIKLVQSLEQNDLEHLAPIRDGIYNNTFHYNSEITGPNQIRFIIVTPDKDPETTHHFESNGIEVIRINPQTFSDNGLMRQTILSEYTIDQPQLHSSKLLADDLY